MKEYKGQVIHVFRPQPKVRRYLDETMTLSPKRARVRVRLDNGETLTGLPEPADVRLMRGDRITLRADLTRGGTIGPLQEDEPLDRRKSMANNHRHRGRTRSGMVQPRRS